MPNLKSMLASDASNTLSPAKDNGASPRSPRIADITLGDTAYAADSHIDGSEQITLIGYPRAGTSTLQNSIIGQLRGRGSYILLEVSADYDRLAGLAALHQSYNASAKFQVLNFDKPDQSNTYNPLIRGSAKAVAERIMRALTNQAYAKWRLSDAEFTLAIEIVAVLVQALRDRDGVAQFNGLHEALSSPAGFDALISSPHLSLATRAEITQRFSNYRNSGADHQSYNFDEIRKPLAKLLLVLPHFATGPMGAVFNVATPDIDLIDGLRTRKGLLVMLQTMTKDGIALATGRLILADLCDGLEELSQTPAADQPVAMLLTTETPCFSTDNLQRTFAAAKAAGVGVLAGISSIGNLDKFSLKDQQALLNNKAIKVFLKNNANDTSDELKEFGNTLVKADVPYTLDELTADFRSPPGEGVIVRDDKVAKLTVWPDPTLRKRV